MELKSTISIAHGLSHTDTLEFLDISSNPIGQSGMRLVLQAMNKNQNTKFTVNLKNIQADKGFEIKNDQAFDPSNPEGKFLLDIGESYGQVILQQLLSAAEKAANRSSGAFEAKQCFNGASLNGKGKWEPPLEKNSYGLFNLGDEPTGTLKFNFTLNPPVYKDLEK